MPRTPTSGVFLAAAMLLTGAVTAGIAWWYNLAHTRRALAYWGSPAVALIRDAPHVTAHHVAFASSAATTVPASRPLLHPTTHTRARVLATRDISRAKGLLHLRRALLDDQSFDWQASPSDPGKVAYVLIFDGGHSRLVLYFSSDYLLMTSSFSAGGTLQDGQARKTISTRPIADGLRTYFAELFP